MMPLWYPYVTVCKSKARQEIEQCLGCTRGVHMCMRELAWERIVYSIVKALSSSTSHQASYLFAIVKYKREQGIFHALTPF